MAAKNRITVNITSEFKTFLEYYAQEHGFKSVSEALVSLASDSVREAGFEGQIMLGRGKYQREVEAIMAEADRLTDYGRNDPGAD